MHTLCQATVPSEKDSQVHCTPGKNNRPFRVFTTTVAKHSVWAHKSDNLNSPQALYLLMRSTLLIQAAWREKMIMQSSGTNIHSQTQLQMDTFISHTVVHRLNNAWSVIHHDPGNLMCLPTCTEEVKWIHNKGHTTSTVWELTEAKLISAHKGTQNHTDTG